MVFHLFSLYSYAFDICFGIFDSMHTECRGHLFVFISPDTQLKYSQINILMEFLIGFIYENHTPIALYLKIIKHQ